MINLQHTAVMKLTWVCFLFKQFKLHNICVHVLKTASSFIWIFVEKHQIYVQESFLRSLAFRIMPLTGLHVTSNRNLISSIVQSVKNRYSRKIFAKTILMEMKAKRWPRQFRVGHESILISATNCVFIKVIRIKCVCIISPNIFTSMGWDHRNDNISIHRNNFCYHLLHIS